MELDEAEQVFLNENIWPGVSPHAQDVNYLVKGWIEFGQKVSDGYRLDTNSYTNDLSKRTILDDIIKAGPESLCLKINAAIQAADQHFEAHTVPISRPLEGDAYDWWMARIPRLIYPSLSGWLDIYLNDIVEGEHPNYLAIMPIADGDASAD